MEIEIGARPTLGSPEFWDRLVNNPERLAAEVCFIDVVDLDKTLQQHAALHAWVSAAYEVARVDEERAKWEITKAKAEALLKSRGDPDPTTGKAKTVDVMNAEAEVAKNVEMAQEALFPILHKRGALKAMASALEDRRDMLIQISAKRRQEAETYKR